MKKALFILFWATFLAGAFLLTNGCGKSPVPIDPQWTPPVGVSQSEDRLAGWLRLYKCRNGIIGVSSSPDFLFLNSDSNAWSQLSSSVDRDDYIWGYATSDPQSMRILVAQGYATEDQQLVIRLFSGLWTKMD